MSTSCERAEIAPSPRRQKILRHLQALYPPGTPGELLAYVKTPFKRIFGRPDDLESFADQIVALDQAGYDTYLTINTLDGAAVRGRGLRARGCEAEVVAVVAIVADIDAAPKPGHDYPTQLEIHKALLEMPRYPSIVVVSGRKNGGLHVYWLLDKPYLIRDQADRHRLKNISRRLQELLRSKLDGREMDSTYDLVRVLRPIGSTNYKYGTVVVEAHELDPAMKAQAEAGLGASLDDLPYDRDSIDEIEAALPPLPPLPDLSLPPIVIVDECQAEAVARAANWLSQRAPAIAASHGGGGGDAHTYNTAVCLVHGFGLPIDAALPLMWRWNRRCAPSMDAGWTSAQAPMCRRLGGEQTAGLAVQSRRCRRMANRTILRLITATFRLGSFIVPRPRFTKCGPSTRWNRFAWRCLAEIAAAARPAAPIGSCGTIERSTVRWPTLLCPALSRMACRARRCASIPEKSTPPASAPPASIWSAAKSGTAHPRITWQSSAPAGRGF